MNPILQLKGQFQQKKNTSSPGARNLPNGQFVSVEHISDLINQLTEIGEYWKKETLIQGALVSVHYHKIVAKSNRLQGLLGNGSDDPNKTICGAKFSIEEPVHHIFTHFVQIKDLDRAICNLTEASRLITSMFGNKITTLQLDQINNKRINYPASELARSTFAKIVVDCYYVHHFSIDKWIMPTTVPAIITLYKTNIQTKALLLNLGISIPEAKMIDETTIRLDPSEIRALQEKAPYLIAMQTHDLSELNLESITSISSDIIQIPDPSNEPVIGVIDTPFYDNTYFSKWVNYESRIDSNIEIRQEDYYHGTEVTSIIVDGPTFNPVLDDGCGRFRVRHFGVATAGPFSSFRVLKEIRSIIAENSDIKVWNLSLGSVMEINQNFISPEGAELDRIQNDYDVVFVIAGTNKPKSHIGQMKIGAPADSLNSIVVNAVTRGGEPVSYHRVGPVLSFFHKPDISYYGGDTYEKMRVCTPTGEGAVCGTSFAAPWITRKIAFLIYKMGFSREIAKALLIDAAAGWNRRDDLTHSVGYGVVPIHINQILHTAEDEIRFVMTGTTDEYETYTYNIPVPNVNDRHPFFARATLCYFPRCVRTQGVDYTSTEMDIHFGRVSENKDHKVSIKSLDNNQQGDPVLLGLPEAEARKMYRKWDNIKLISDAIKKNSKPRKMYGSGMWGLSVRTKERLKGAREQGLQFGVVITLKEMNGINRIDEFIRLCMVRGWIVNRIDVNNQLDIYTHGEEDIIFN